MLRTMKKVCRTLLVLALCLMLLPAVPARAAKKNTLSVSFSVTTYQNRARSALKLINEIRREAGLGELEMLADLEKTAIQRAAELFVFFDHDRPNLTEYDTAYADYENLAGCTAVAECIAAGFSKAEEAVADWGANAIDLLLDEEFTHVGIACIEVKDSHNGYYWNLYLQGQPEGVKAKAAPDTAKAGTSKTMTVEIDPKMYKRADNSHKRFELRANNVHLKGKTTAHPTVSLYDRYDVKIGRCRPEDLHYQSSNTRVFTVTQDGTVRKKKSGTATLTIEADGLEEVTCEVTVGSGKGSSSHSSPSAVTADTIADEKPDLDKDEFSKHTSLSVYLKGSSGYVLYRATAKNGHYTKAQEKNTTKRWTVKIDHDELERGYYYKVRAFKNKNGRRVYSQYSTPVKVEP